MTVLWALDSCQCEIIIENDRFEVNDFVQKCAIHNTPQALIGFFNQVIAHNKTFLIRKAGPIPTEDEIQTNSSEKRAEQARILNIGPPEPKP